MLNFYLDNIWYVIIA